MMLAWTLLLGLPLLGGLCPGAAAVAAASPYEQDYLIVEERIAAARQYSVRRARLVEWDELLQDDGTFSDLDYNKGGESEELQKHATRLEDVIQRDLKDSNNTKLSDKAKKSFLFFTYDIPKLVSDNLWLYVIRVPNLVWPLVFRARDHFNETVKMDFLDRYFNTTQGPVWDPTLLHTKNAGGNLSPRLRHGLTESFLRRRLPEFRDEVKILLHRELVLRDPYMGAGQRQDGCLHQHNRIYTNTTTNKLTILGQIYSNNYGKETLRNLPVALWELHGTAFDLGPEIEDAIFETFFACHQWLFRGKTVEPSSVGRFIDQGKIITKIGAQDGVREPLKYFQKVNHRQTEVTAAFHRYNNVRPEKQYALEGNRYFHVSDIVAHQRQDFMASLRILSRRTCRPETIPPYGYSATFYKGNKEGYFMGDGFLTVLVTSKELGSYLREVFQVYDFARIPGVTIQYTKNVPQVSSSLGHLDPAETYNDVDFAGGVTNKMEGVVAMEYARIPVALRALKTWFFFDNVILCLGSGITLPTQSITQYPVTTTLNQVVSVGTFDVGDKTFERQHSYSFDETVDRKLSKDYDLTEGLWFHHDTIGYVPIVNSGKVNVEVQQKLIFGSETETIQKFSLWLDHGPNPSDSKYAYAMLPAHTVADTKDFAAQNTATILSLDNSRHVACSRPLKLLGMVFFSKGCTTMNTCLATALDTVCTDQQALVMVKDVESDSSDVCPDGVTPLKISSGNDVLPTKTLQVSVADPTQKLKTINLTFKKGETTYPIPVTTPLHPKTGTSVVMCLSLS